MMLNTLVLANLASWGWNSLERAHSSSSSLEDEPQPLRCCRLCQDLAGDKAHTPKLRNPALLDLKGKKLLPGKTKAGVEETVWACGVEGCQGRHCDTSQRAGLEKTHTQTMGTRGKSWDWNLDPWVIPIHYATGPTLQPWYFMDLYIYVCVFL